MTTLARGGRLAVMARPAVGTVIRKRTGRGTSYALRVTFHGERVFVPLGGSWDGWTEERVQAEREHIARMIARGEWTPPDHDQPAAAPGEPPSFQVFASEWLERKRRRVGTKTHSDLLWRLTMGMDHFGPHRVDRIDEVVIEDFVQAMLAEREAIRVAAAAGHPLMQTIALPDGRTYERRRRPLSNGSINKAIAAVRMVLKDARRRYPKHVLRNPAAERDVYLKVPPAARSFLEPHHIAAMLEAAHQLDGRGGVLDWDKVAYIRQSDKSAVKLARDLGVSDVLIGKVRRGLVWNDARAGNRRQRRAIIGALVLAGPRISELCGLPDDRLDLAGGRILIPPRDMDETGPQTKTFAGERIIPMVPALRDILLESRASSGARKCRVLRAELDRVLHTQWHAADAGERRPSRPRAHGRARRGAASRAPADADAERHAAHAAAHVRVDPCRVRRRSAPRDVPARPHRREAHAQRLPAGPRHERRRRRHARAGSRRGPRRDRCTAQRPDPPSPAGGRAARRGRRGLPWPHRRRAMSGARRRPA